MTLDDNTRDKNWEIEYQEFHRFAQEFSAESDRAAVILGAAKLDLLLAQLLQRTLRPSTSKSDELIEGDAPLGTFSARCLICYRLGLIDDGLFSALNMIRKIRNSFAHEISGVSLDSGAHRDRIRELVAPIRQNSGFKWLVKDIYGSKQGPSTEFRAAVALVALRLEGACESHVPLYCKDPQTLVYDEDDSEEPSTEGDSSATS